MREMGKVGGGIKDCLGVLSQLSDGRETRGKVVRCPVSGFSALSLAASEWLFMVV